MEFFKLPKQLNKYLELRESDKGKLIKFYAMFRNLYP